MRNSRTIVLVEVALAVALSTVLQLLALQLPINIAGGSISLTMLPVAVVALRRGVAAGMATGAIFGMIDLIMEPFILFPAQVALDYPVPYILFGLGVGLFAPLYRRVAEKPVVLGTSVVVGALLAGGVLRYLCHVCSGVLFFAEYAEGQNVWLYSLIYNFTYIAPSLFASLLCALVVVPLVQRAVPVMGRGEQTGSVEQA